MNRDAMERSDFLRGVARWGLGGVLAVLVLAVSRRWTSLRECLQPGRCAACPQVAHCPMASDEDGNEP